MKKLSLVLMATLAFTSAACGDDDDDNDDNGGKCADDGDCGGDGDTGDGDTGDGDTGDGDTGDGDTGDGDTGDGDASGKCEQVVDLWKSCENVPEGTQEPDCSGAGSTNDAFWDCYLDHPEGVCGEDADEVQALTTCIQDSLSAEN